jgi:hypothetical protein
MLLKPLYMDPHPVHTLRVPTATVSPMITPTTVYVHSESPNHFHAQSCTFPAVPSRNQSPQDSRLTYSSNGHAPPACTLAVSSAHFFLQKHLFLTSPHTHVVPLLFPLATENLPAVRLKSMYMIPAVRLMAKESYRNVYISAVRLIDCATSHDLLQC